MGNHKEDWAIYFATVGEDSLGSVLVDLGLNSVAPLNSKPFLITISTFMNSPTEDGLSSDEENDQLNEIENNFIDLIVERYEAVYVGRLKYDGKMLSYFYCQNADDFDDFFADAKKRYPDYHFAHSIKEEKDWQAYFDVLYPSPYEMQVIKNGLVIEHLEELGDKLEKERPVDHWIYFKSEIDRGNFLAAIDGHQFEVRSRDLNSVGESPFSLQLSRVDKVDYQKVDEYVMYLWETAQEHNGDYDGWETFVVKD